MAVSPPAELAILIDVLVKRGISVSELKSGINQGIKAAFKKLYPITGDNIKVFNDDETGDIKIFIDGVDKTPPGFQEKSQAAAKEYLLERIKNSEDHKPATTASPNQPPAPPHFLKWIGVFLFYFYNSLYLMALVFSGYLLTKPNAIKNLTIVLKEVGYLHIASAVVLFLVPLFCLYKLLGNRWYKDSTKTLKLFLFFEIPILFFLFIITFALGNPTKVTWFISLSVLVIPLLGLNKIESVIAIPVWKKRLDTALLLISTLLITYIVIIYSFYFPAILIYLIKEACTTVSRTFTDSYLSAGSVISNVLGLGLGSLGFLLVLAILFIPFIFAGISWKILVGYYKNLASSTNLRVTNYFLGVVFILTIVLTAALSYQPDRSAVVNKLSEFGEQTDFEAQELQAEELVPQQDSIKEIIKDMSNSRSRYLMSKDESIIENMYNSLGGPEKISSGIQRLFSFVSYPFIYQGQNIDDSKALENYEKVFGSYYEQDIKEQKYVNLLSRNVTGKTFNNGAIAQINIEEEYQQNSANNWPRDEEILYEFSLPEGAVVTDLKLGPNLEFPGVLAPRGAAQKTYQQEVNKFRDPAILEQTGPRQYRLRIFPVPRKDDKTTLGGKNQKVSFTYTTLLSDKGFGLPVYSREQNIDSDAAKISLTLDNNPKSISAETTYITSSTPICSLTATIDIPLAYASGSATLVPANGNDLQNKKLGCDPNLLRQITAEKTGLRVAIVYDASATNKDNAALEEIQQWIRNSGTFVTQNIVDFYKFNTGLSRPTKLTSTNDPTVVYFGESDIKQIIPVLFSEHDYNEIIVVTNRNDYGIFAANARLEKEILSYPRLHFIFKDGKIPAFTQDLSIQFIQSKAEISDSFTDVMNSIVTPKTFMGIDNFNRYISLNNYWSVSVPSSTTSSIVGTRTDENSITLPIATAAVIKDRIYGSGGTDYLNLEAFAAQSAIAGVVTPYSSYIALVNETQKQNLMDLSQSADRFLDTYSNLSSFRLPAAGGGFGVLDSPSLPNLNSPQNFSSGGAVGLSAPGGSLSGSSLIFDSFYTFNLGILFIGANIVLLVIGFIIFIVIRQIRKRRNT